MPRLVPALKRKIAGGAICIALSGFVPKITKPAQGATATITARGTFSSGLQVTPAPGRTQAQFGKVVATAETGTFRMTPGGGSTMAGGFSNGGTALCAELAFNAGALRKMDISVVGLKASLTLGTLNGIATGIVDFTTVKAAGPFAGTLTFSPGSAKQTVSLTSVTQDIAVCGGITWHGGKPVGTFSHQVQVIVSF
ncbi:MAG: hypothetical protein ACPGRX_08185 [Bdellovibrionales bacterium]